jgi:two-component system, chemotaxis family, CheB/CheR fusion protein
MSEPEDRSSAGRQAGGDLVAGRRAPCPVVGIGGSAGGIEAFRNFLAAVPPDCGIAFVIIQHLAPHQESRLTEVLRPAARIEVVEIADDTPVEPNHVYVTPENSVITIQDGVLRLASPVGETGRRAPIDLFLLSLAEDQGENAACILVSGAGHDGTLGLRAIKEHGGLTLAQSAATAAHDSMLRSAVQTGLVDFQLAVEEMPQRLAAYFDHVAEVERKRREGQGEIASDDLARICQVLHARTGHDFSDYKERTLVRRVQRRMQVLQTADLAHYLDQLTRREQEAEHLFKDLLIGVTQFFRDPDAFRALAERVVPKLLEKRSGAADCVRVWVAGCATGEEAYSIAIALREGMAAAGVAPELQIFASDIDDSALQLARNGRYPLAIENDVSAERLERFFVRENGTYRVRSALRESCVFAHHNIIRDPPFSRLDLVSCRNLLIYMNASLQQKLIPILHYALLPDGYLFLGPSENVSQHGGLFAPVDKKQRLFIRRQDGLKHLPKFPITDARELIQSLGRDGQAAARTGSRLTRAVERVLEAHGPTYVVVNDRDEIVRSSKGTGRYLELGAGPPDLNLLSMARSDLRATLRALLQQAMQSGQAARDHAEVEIDGARQPIDIIVEPVSDPERGRTHYVILFRELERARPQTEPRSSDGQRGPEPDLVGDLERELRQAREQLHIVTEQLETSNEELRSSNEELSSVNEEMQSTNEELQTSKEELQSINEELQTVNLELNGRVDELSRANSDLKNLLENTRIPIVFLDNSLAIKNFTPSAKELFSLRDNDHGRPITEITHRLDSPDLAKEIRKVIESQSGLEREVDAGDGRSYIMRILLYRTVEDEVSGVVITFTDITERKKTEQHQRLLLAELNHRVKNMLATVQAIATQTIRGSRTLESFADNFKGRLMALAGGHDLLTESSWRGAHLRDVVQAALRPYLAGNRIEVLGAELPVTPKAALALSLILHELATNAAKYGALSVPSGSIRLDWQIEGAGAERAVRLRWREAGGPEVAPPDHTGFGLTLIERSVAHELDGEARVDFARDGICCELRLPYSRDNFQDLAKGEIAAD